jgi:Uncharacterised nucleotidyltransferase
MGLSHAERQLILLSAGTSVRREAMREQAARLMVDIDWSRLAEGLRLRRLLPTLGPRIIDLAERQASDDFAVTVEQAIETVRRQAVFLQLVSLRVMKALNEAEIRCISLKGPLLGETIYGDPGRRLSSDIDLLVAPEQLQAAVRVVRELEYKAPVDHVDRAGLPKLHFLLVHEQQKLPPVELHWRVHWYEKDFARERLLPPSVDQPGNWRPAPTDELSALLLFYARDGFIDLRLATDLSAWWDLYGAEVSPDALKELLSDYPGLARVIPVAIKVAEKVVGLPATQIIMDMPKLDLRDRTAIRLANPNPHTSQSQLYADRGLIDGLLTPPGEFGAFVRRQLLPPREVLDEQARHGSKRRARSPLSRCAGMLTRYGLTMARLARVNKEFR